MESNDFSDLGGDLSVQELAEVMLAAKAAGMTSQVTFLDDSESLEARRRSIM